MSKIQNQKRDSARATNGSGKPPEAKNSIETGQLILVSLLSLNLLIVFWFWFKVSGQTLSLGLGPALIAFGRLAGLVTVLLVLGQVVMISGAHFFEDKIGFDRVTRYHRLNGITLAFVILLHPALLILGYSQLTGNNLFNQWLALERLEDVLNASLGFTLLLTIAAVSGYRRLRQLLSYEQWYYFHLLVYVVILLVFGHQFHNGAELLSQPLFRAYWYALYALALLTLLYMRYWRPFWNWRKFNFKVEKVDRITPSAVSIWVSGRNLERLNYRPGQFAKWRFINRKVWWQAHPFTISIEPNGQHLRISAKAVGDFTQQLEQMVKPGDPVIFDGPFGILTPDRSVSDRVLLIAGGSGITPLRAMLPELLVRGSEVTLLYGNQSHSETMLGGELDRLAKEHPSFNWYNVVSEGAVKGQESGIIDEDKIKRLAGERLKGFDIYLCGPPSMMDKVESVLIKLGADPNRIYTERYRFAA
jgi:predicted ferric reductase